MLILRDQKKKIEFLETKIDALQAENKSLIEKVFFYFFLYKCY